MTAPDTAADLTALAAWIDEQLGDETADQRWIAESTASKIRDITLQMLGADFLAAMARQAVPGPFETRAAAGSLAAIRAAYHDSQTSTRRERNHRLLDEACAATGVELGAYDHRIVTWLSGWEPETCAVIAGLVARAAGMNGGRR